MSLFILPLLVTAHSTLGFIFGIQSGRPGWFSALQAPGFVVMAGISGIGLLIVITAIVRHMLHLEQIIGEGAFRWLGNFVWILVLLYSYFVIAEELTTSYAGAAKERAYVHEVVWGAYANLFWTVVFALGITFAIFFIQFVRHTVSIGWSIVGGLVVNVAAVLKRFLIVVPSQTHGMLIDYPEGWYRPSWVEICVILGLVALATLLFSTFVKLFPIVPAVAHPDPKAAGPASGQSFRMALAVSCFLIGLGLATFGFLISARVGTRPAADPLVPFSPVLFILGVMITCCTGAVYETLPRSADRV
jgi:molybdopterin-containing oxidoreductase family membrane subunit